MLTIIIPLFNEEKNVPVLYEKLVEELKKLKEPYEIIFVDDGSTDQSLEVLKEIEKKDKTIRIFSFRKNYGKAEALFLGFQKARGERIVTLDADLQDVPSEMKKLLMRIDEGWDLVCGWRKNRKDGYLKILSSKLFNFLASIFLGLNLHDYNCGLKAYRKEAAKSLNLYGGLHRFIPLLLHQQGFHVCEVEVVHEKRKFGKSKFGFSKVWKDLPDMFTIFFLTRYSDRPLHFFGTVGGVILFIGFLILGYLTYIWFMGASIGRRPLLLFGILLVLTGIQVLFSGFLADLITLSKKRSNTPENDFRVKYSTEGVS